MIAHSSRDSLSYGMTLKNPYHILYLEMTHHEFLHQVVPLGLLKHGKVSHVMLQKRTLSLRERKWLERLGSHKEIIKPM
jgi:hypothetical protein